MAYKMATGKGSNIANVLPTPDPTDPKKKTTTVTSEKVVNDGISGTLKTFTTKTPGSGGGEGSGNIPVTTPEGDKAYAAKSPAEQKAQDAKWKAMNAVTPGETNVSSRFTPDAITLKSMPRVDYKPEIKADEIKPIKNAINLDAPSGQHFFQKQVNQPFGGHTTTGRSDSAVSGPNFGDENYGNVTQSRPMTQREQMLLSTDVARRTGGATASPFGKGGEQGFQSYLSNVESMLSSRAKKLKSRKNK